MANTNDIVKLFHDELILSKLFIPDQSDEVWTEISMSSAITMDIVLKHPELSWNWYKMYRNPHFTFDMVLKFPTKPWCWFGISHRSDITINFVLDNLDKSWNWYSLSCNSIFTMDFIQQNLNLPWNWSGIGRNPNFTVEMVLKHKNEYLLHSIRFNNNISLEDILKHPELPWDSDYVKKLCLERDNDNAIHHKIKWLLITTIYEQFDELHFYDPSSPYSAIERILSDSYLAKQLIKY